MIYIGAGWPGGAQEQVMVGLLERDAELAAIDEFLAAAGLRLVLLAGEAGIGKTALWEAGRVRARGRGYRVLSMVTSYLRATSAFFTG